MPNFAIFTDHRGPSGYGHFRAAFPSARLAVPMQFDYAALEYPRLVADGGRHIGDGHGRARDGQGRTVSLEIPIQNQLSIKIEN